MFVCFWFVDLINLIVLVFVLIDWIVWVICVWLFACFRWLLARLRFVYLCCYAFVRWFLDFVWCLLRFVVCLGYVVLVCLLWYVCLCCLGVAVVTLLWWVLVVCRCLIWLCLYLCGWWLDCCFFFWCLMGYLFAFYFVAYACVWLVFMLVLVVTSGLDLGCFGYCGLLTCYVAGLLLAIVLLVWLLLFVALDLFWLCFDIVCFVVWVWLWLVVVGWLLDACGLLWFVC